MAGFSRSSGFKAGRRAFLASALSAPGAAGVLTLLAACGGGGNAAIAGDAAASRFGVLGLADINGVRLPAGFSSRIVAHSGRPAVAGSPYLWPPAPDGGAVFPAPDGWIYVCNSEIDRGGGGVAALRFDNEGQVIDAYPILSGTSRNCAGGATPWGTWLSCEEVDRGRVWECDPQGVSEALVRPALGAFMHEAVAVDPINWQLYLTEDRPDGRFYRFTPHAMLSPDRPDLSSGLLEVGEIVDPTTMTMAWRAVRDPSASRLVTRYQVESSTVFNGGEGIYYHQGSIYFSTKGDDRIWRYAIAESRLSIVYDAGDYAAPVLTGVDNLTVSSQGEVFVAEDGGNLQVVALTLDGGVVPVVELVGHGGSEIAGVAFDPSGQRLYFSSQRGTSGRSADGVTFEVSGPFLSRG